jgi:hypothetical protein
MLSKKLNSIFLDPPDFSLFLDKQLAWAERYNYFVSILLFKPEGLEESGQGSSLDHLAWVLAGNVRKSDYVGCIQEGTLATILLHASSDTVGIVLERLKFECFISLSGGSQKVDLKGSYAVYPSEANSVKSLCDLSIQRLADP